MDQSQTGTEHADQQKTETAQMAEAVAQALEPRIHQAVKLAVSEAFSEAMGEIGSTVAAAAKSLTEGMDRLLLGIVAEGKSKEHREEQARLQQAETTRQMLNEVSQALHELARLQVELSKNQGEMFRTILNCLQADTSEPAN